MNDQKITQLAAGTHVAVSAFLRRCVIPLIGDHEGPTALYGCGTLFADRGGHFLVTATHVLEDVPNAEIGIPLDERDSEIWTISASRAAKSPVEQEDVTVVELTDKIISQLEAAGRTFLGPKNVTSAVPAAYLAFGYRLGDVKATESSIGAAPTLISALPYSGPTDNVSGFTNSWYDLLLQWREVLSLRGISGSPLWALEPAGQGLWVPEDSVKLVGVQRGAVPGQWIRGTKWAIVSKLIDKLADTHPSPG
jgi:hypothetical protein